MMNNNLTEPYGLAQTIHSSRMLVAKWPRTLYALHSSQISNMTCANGTHITLFFQLQQTYHFSRSVSIFVEVGTSTSEEATGW